MSRRANTTYDLETLPSRPELASIEPALESLADLASRRDVLRLMAQKMSDEANAIDRELTSHFASHERELRSLAARLTQG